MDDPLCVQRHGWHRHGCLLLLLAWPVRPAGCAGRRRSAPGPRSAARRGGLRPVYESIKLHIQTFLDAGVASTAIAKGKGTVALNREGDAVTRTPQSWVAQAEDEESAEPHIVCERKWIAAESTAGLSRTGLCQFEHRPVAVGCLGGTAVELKALGIGKIMEGEGSRRAWQVRQERGF